MTVRFALRLVDTHADTTMRLHHFSNALVQLLSFALTSEMQTLSVKLETRKLSKFEPNSFLLVHSLVLHFALPKFRTRILQSFANLHYISHNAILPRNTRGNSAKRSKHVPTPSFQRIEVRFLAEKPTFGFFEVPTGLLQSSPSTLY